MGLFTSLCENKECRKPVEWFGDPNGIICCYCKTVQTPELLKDSYFNGISKACHTLRELLRNERLTRAECVERLGDTDYVKYWCREGNLSHNFLD